MLFRSAVAVYADAQRNAQTATAEQDGVNWRQVEDDLRAEWGHEYRANMNVLLNFFPEDLVEEVFTGRGGVSGVKLGGHKRFMEHIVGIMKKYAPDETIVPGGADNSAAESEFDALDTEFKNDYPNFIRDKKKYDRWSALKDVKSRREQRERGRAA